MYLIKTSHDAQVTLTGTRANPQSHPITLKPGWNWIGYLSPMTMSLNEALASVTPSENDVIKGQTDFSAYSVETGWQGSLTMMQPGQGYIYQNAGNTNATLIYPQSSRGDLEVTPAIKHWTHDAHRFPTNLTMMVTLDPTEFVMGEGSREIGAFVNDECRGSARIQYIENLGHHVAFLTVCGEEGEKVSFRLFDVINDEVNASIAKERIIYHADAVHGTLKSPMTLHFQDTGVNEQRLEVSLFPNPTTGKVTVKATGMNRLTVTDVLGQVVYDTEADTDQTELNLSACESGVYMIRVSTTNGTALKRLVLAK